MSYAAERLRQDYPWFRAEFDPELIHKAARASRKAGAQPMSKPTTDPAIREAEARGARRERQAMRRHLRARLREVLPHDERIGDHTRSGMLQYELGWLLTREARYKRAAGGLTGRGGR